MHFKNDALFYNCCNLSDKTNTIFYKFLCYNIRQIFNQMAYPMTQEGANALRKELDQLIHTERPQVIKDISEARAHGDLKENGEYHAAKEKQGFIEAKIKDLQNRLGDAKIIDVKELENDGKVVFGSTVTIVNSDTEQQQIYKIVGEYESDLESNKISYQAPIAKALIGNWEGDYVMVKTPGGEVEYEILKVEYL